MIHDMFLSLNVCACEGHGVRQVPGLGQVRSDQGHPTPGVQRGSHVSAIGL